MHILSYLCIWFAHFCIFCACILHICILSPCNGIFYAYFVCAYNCTSKAYFFYIFPDIFAYWLQVCIFGDVFCIFCLFQHILCISMHIQCIFEHIYAYICIFQFCRSAALASSWPNLFHSGSTSQHQLHINSLLPVNTVVHAGQMHLVPSRPRVGLAQGSAKLRGPLSWENPWQ